MLINFGTIGPQGGVAKLAFLKFNGSHFSALRLFTRPQSFAFINKLGQIEKTLSISGLDS
jgi:hypothetical protein